MTTKQNKKVRQHFELELPFAQHGIDDSPINSIRRALDRIIREGKPLQKLGTVIVELPVNGAVLPFWLGSFVFSAGNRLCFFPAYSKPLGRLVKYKGDSKIGDTQTVIDHITLEKDRGSWHLTTHGSRDHFAGAPSLPASGERVLWFGLSIAFPSVLQPVRKKTTLRWEVPSTDAKRPHENIIQAITEVEHMRLRLVDDTLEKPPEEHFYHYAVNVGDPDMMTTANTEHAFPFGSPFVEPPLPKDLRFFGSALTMLLPSHCAIQVTAVRLPGRLTLPMHFTGQTKPLASLIEMKVHVSPDKQTT
jgi:hypothetical protein